MRTRPDAPCIRKRSIWLAFCLLVFAGCVSGKIERARSRFYAGDAVGAGDVLRDPQEIPRRDRLLFYMEKGSILHEAGKYRESSEALLQAVRFIEEEERISVSRQGGSLVTSERLTVYRGEYEERLLLHTYLMMNYLLLSAYDDAFVEARQALVLLDEHASALKEDYFTRALVAHCFEAVGETNGAYIEYRKLADAMPDPSPVLPKLYRLARQLGFSDDARAYAETISGEPLPDVTAAGEAILFIAQGRGPVKVPRNIIVPPTIRFSFAGYRERSLRFFRPDVLLTSERQTSASMVTTDLAAVLQASLNERTARMLAKETLRVTAKESISRSIEDPFAETLVRLAFFLSEEPDTRGWQTLPAYLTMGWIPMSEGVHAPAVTDVYGKTVELPPVSVHGKKRFFYYSIRLEND